MPNDWTRLLSEKRLIRTDAGELKTYLRQETPPRTAAEADVQRIIFSSPFRRLAGKTQVHPFARVDYVHNRLTHSLEVAETASALAQRVLNRPELTPAQQRAAVLHVRAASLGHDIGNPPYGHVGEAVIRAWATARRADLNCYLLEHGSPERANAALCRDLCRFDGNAQTFRLLSHPMPREGAHFRLTCATLGALIKYPYDSGETETCKFSVFTRSHEEFTAVRRELGLPAGARHPLAYLLEIADDICYCVTDCEDALLMEILQPETVRTWFLRLFADGREADACRRLPIAHLRAKVIHHLLGAFADELRDCFHAPESLAAWERESPAWKRLKALKSDYKIVFSDERKLEKEAQIRSELTRALDRVFEALQLCDRTHRTAAQEQLLTATFGEVPAKPADPESARERLHTLLDLITGMSDAALRHFIGTV